MPHTPLVNLRLFRHRAYAMGCLVSGIYGIALFGSTYLLPVYMQVALQMAPSVVGTVLLPAGIVLAITIPAVGHLADRQPTHRLVSIGLLLLAASFNPHAHAGTGRAHRMDHRLHRAGPHRTGLRAALAQPGRHAQPAAGILVPGVEHHQLPARRGRRRRREPVWRDPAMAAVGPRGAVARHRACGRAAGRLQRGILHACGGVRLAMLAAWRIRAPTAPLQRIDDHVPTARTQLRHAHRRHLQLHRFLPARWQHRRARRRLGIALLRGPRPTPFRGP